MTDFSSTDEDPALEQYALIAPCVEDGVSQKIRAVEVGVSRKTISRLIEKFKTGGIDALRRKTRADKGQPRVSESTFKFIKGLNSVTVITPDLVLLASKTLLLDTT